MIIDLENYDLMKALTRTEAKKVHKDLPDGGVWRTIKGHHIYIKDGKILAGSIPGVTKAKKMTKATMAEHQAALDAEGKKKDGKQSKPKGAGKAPKQAGKTAGSDSKGAGGAKKAKTSGSGKKAVVAPKKTTSKGTKASGTKKVEAKTDDNVKKPTAKPSTTGKPVSNGGKKATPKSGAKSQPAAEAGGVSEADKHLKELAASSSDGMDMWANAHENPEHLKALKDKLKETDGKMTDRLNAIHKEYGGGSEVPEYKPANNKAFDDFEASKPEKGADSLTVKYNPYKTNHASAPTGTDIRVGKPMMDGSTSEDEQKHILSHEVGHVISNLHPSLEKHIMDNPQDALGRTNVKKGRFEGNFGTATPEESFAESYAVYHNNPEELKKKYPKAYDFIKAVTGKLPHHQDYLDKARSEYDKLTGKIGDKAKPEKPVAEDSHYELFHGTSLPTLSKILSEGFLPNGGHSDFGNAAYFKSPSFDDLDHEDHKKWVAEKQAKGQPVPERYLTSRGNNSEKIVNFFKSSKEPAVVKALVPKEHFLDCTKGRPKELQKLITLADKLEGEGTREATLKFVLEGISGVDTKGMSDQEVREAYDKHLPEMEKFWGLDAKGRKFRPSKVSPYEIYAKKTGIKAIVDKLDVFKEEGWQIGVYDPKIIKITDHGRDIKYNPDKNRAELIKALRKAMKNAPYCLLHHEITPEGLVMHIGVQGGNMEKSLYVDLDLEKAITRKDAKALHGELPPGGEWRTIRGHHIYIKDGKVLAGSIPGVTKAKKATKAQLAEHQATIDAENKKKKPSKTKEKASGKDATGSKKVPEKPKTPAKGAKRSNTAKPSPDNAGKTPSTKKQAGKKAAPKAAPKETKKPKDIRTDAQKNRELAYDVGEKVGGARKDEFEASFKAKPTQQSLADLEKMSGAVAEKMVTKANLLPKHSFEDEHANGTDLPTAILKKLVTDRIAPKPEPSNPETRKAYLNALTKFQRHFAGIKDFEQMIGAVRELSQMARKAKRHDEAKEKLDRYKQGNSGYSYLNEDLMNQYMNEGKDAKKFMDFTALGDKFHNFLTNYESMNRTIDTVRKNTKEGWEKYLTPQAKAAPKEKGAENKRWKREAEAEHLRTGGKETKVKKPEDLMKEFGLRGVEFGHWVNDASGLYHLKRSAEAFDDLSDVLGVDKKDISLNNRLAIAFGARGKGGALAHYEPDRKVINMTKYGGAGSLAHEWGHAMDNILYQYSHGGQESLGHASDGGMGNADPKLNTLYQNLMDAITKPAPGDKGGVTNLILDSEAKQLTRYYPEMRRQVNSGMEPKDVYHHWAQKVNEQYDRYVNSAKNSPYNRTDADKEKAVKKYEQKRARELKDISHYLAHELRLKQNGGKHGGDHYKGSIEIPTGKSEYLTRMEETQPGKTQNGAHYWSQAPEMFARVFESYVQDKLKKAKRYNNYLVHGTGEGNVKVEGAPFPLGKEREHMFKAMGNLLDYVGKKGTLKKALLLEILASGIGDMTEELRKSARIEELDNLWKTTLNNDIDRLKELGINAESLRPLGTGLQPKRSAYNVANPDEVIYIPINRLQTPYQTEKATNWDKVEENRKKMEAGEHLEPVSIGLNYDVHDGHHRIEASKKCGHEHIPCVVKGGNDIDRERAVEAYKEVWKSLTVADEWMQSFQHYKDNGETDEGAFEETVVNNDLDAGEEADFRAYLMKHGVNIAEHFMVNKSIQPDPTNPYEHEPNVMFRGIGYNELRSIKKTGVIQSKGKGNDADKGVRTCFSNLWSQAEGYARSNYDLYHELHAYVLVVRKPADIEEDEHGELVSHRPIPMDDIIAWVYIPKPDIMKSFDDLIKSFDEGKHPRDEKGRFSLSPGVRAQLAKVVKEAKPVNAKKKTVHTGSVFGLEAKLEEVVKHIVKPLTDHSREFDRQEALKVIADLKKMGFRRNAENDRDNDKQTHAAYLAEFRVNPSKALIIKVMVGKWKHNGHNATGVITCRYLGEAQAHQKERKKKIFAEHNAKKKQ